MTEENGFHAALDANPDDHVTRQVFADWLQERGDPRAEGYRALGVHRKSPRLTDNYLYRWHDDGRDEEDSRTLPHDWWSEAWQDMEQRHLFYRATRRGADDAAAHAFARLPPERRAELLNPHKLRRRGSNYRYATERTGGVNTPRLSVGPGEPLMGGADFMHEITDHTGVRVGHVWVSPQEGGTHLHVNHVGAQGHAPNALGLSAVRDVRAQLKAHYPQAKTIGGNRISGAVRANTGKDRSTRRALTRKRAVVRFAKAEKDRHPAHESIRHFPMEHVLRSLANDPKNGASIRGTAKHVLTTGDTSGLWALNDLLQDPGEHSHKGQHPVLKAGYRMMSAADKIHLDRHTRRAMEEAAEAHRAAHPEATHDRHPTTGDYLGQWAPEAAAQRAAFALDDVRSGHGPTTDGAATLRRLRERVKQLSPDTPPADVDESIRRHAFRVGHWYRDTHGIDTTHDKERALQPVQQTVKERGKIVRQNSDGHHANETATRYRRRVVVKFSKVNQSNFIDALRRLRSSNHDALTAAARDVSERMGIGDTHVLGALHDGPGGAVPGVAQAVYGQVAPEKVHELAAWVNGLLPNSPGYAVFHPRPQGPDTLYRIRHEGSGMDVRTRLDRAGIKNRVLIPHRRGFDVLIPDKGNALAENVDEYAQTHGLQVEASPGHFQTVGGRDQAASRATFRNKVVAGEKATQRMGRTNPRRYALDLRGGPVKMDPRAGEEWDHDNLTNAGLKASGRQGYQNNYLQDIVEGGKLADVLDESGQPHAPFFRNLVTNGTDFTHRGRNGYYYNELRNRPHQLYQQVLGNANDPIWLFGPGSEGTTVVHRRGFFPNGNGLGGTYRTTHTAVLHAPALREWAAHPQVGPSLRAHLLRAADHLEAQAAPTPPVSPDAVDHNRMSRRSEVRRYSQHAPENGRLNDEQMKLATEAARTGDWTAWGALGDHLAENGFPNTGSVISKTATSPFGVSADSHGTSSFPSFAHGDFHSHVGIGGGGQPVHFATVRVGNRVYIFRHHHNREDSPARRSFSRRKRRSPCPS